MVGNKKSFNARTLIRSAKYLLQSESQIHIYISRGESTCTLVKKRNVNVRTYVLRNLVFELRTIKENEVITSC